VGLLLTSLTNPCNRRDDLFPMISRRPFRLPPPSRSVDRQPFDLEIQSDHGDNSASPTSRPGGHDDVDFLHLSGLETY
jgi:hypothetical protein